MVLEKLLENHEFVNGGRFLSAQLTDAASVQQREKAALVHNIQNAVEIPRLTAGQDYSPKDPQKVETRAGRDTGRLAPHSKRSPRHADLLPPRSEGAGIAGRARRENDGLRQSICRVRHDCVSRIDSERPWMRFACGAPGKRRLTPRRPSTGQERRLGCTSRCGVKSHGWGALEGKDRSQRTAREDGPSSSAKRTDVKFCGITRSVKGPCSICVIRGFISLIAPITAPPLLTDRFGRH